MSVSYRFILDESGVLNLKLHFFYSHRELSDVDSKLGVMEENSRNMIVLERQQAEAQSRLDLAKGELNVQKLLDEIEQAK